MAENGSDKYRNSLPAMFLDVVFSVVIIIFHSLTSWIQAPLKSVLFLHCKSIDIQFKKMVLFSNVFLKEKKMDKKIIIGVIFSLLLASGLVFAAKPVRNVNKKHHPNIAAAQKLAQQAFEKISQAQKANEWDMNGHAQKAKELLEQANNELKLAAEAANKEPEKTENKMTPQPATAVQTHK
ncbi:MAG: hypothetical protein HQM08_06350 [Candidatus Riflebacteria bacterium]|nr:hypothetical protein [Candidatus Riflebacteria bacterium]